MEMTRAAIKTWTWADYSFSPGKDQGSEAPVILLLHGFAERARRILKVLGPSLPQDSCLLAPNAPFPLPKKIFPENGNPYYQIGFAWYFFDDIKEEFYIDYSYPAHWLTKLLAHLELNHRPLIIIGYSQGGYLAPFVALENPQTIGVIGINCRFRHDMLSPSPPSYPLYALHSVKDDKVCPKRAKSSFNELVTRGYRGEFLEVNSTGHDIDKSMLDELKQTMKLFLKNPQ
jgi:predicted esterase